jgi:hypothetical protein
LTHFREALVDWGHEREHLTLERNLPPAGSTWKMQQAVATLSSFRVKPCAMPRTPYAVAGTTEQGLWLSINTNRDHEYDALTTWDIVWSFQKLREPVWQLALDIVSSMH